jgi:hypothetical protein
MHVPARLQRILAILAGALFACWPAFLNRYPLLYPDSVWYLRDGRPIAAALFLHHFRGFYAQRSEFYSLGIFLWHWNLSPWPVVALNALLTSYVVSLVIRSILPRRPLLYHLVLMALLSGLSSMSWFISAVMPDILGGVLYLGIYLLIFARETLSRSERWTLGAIVVWTAASHSTHLLLATGLCAYLAILLLVRWQPIARHGRALAQVAMLVSLAAGGLLAIHAYFYGRPSLSGNSPPYLMARFVADGPAAWYLQAHCPTLNWYICDRLHDVPRDSDRFLWAPGGIWEGASNANQQRLLAEEPLLVHATLRAYPRAQIAISLANFLSELNQFTIFSTGSHYWVESNIDRAIPGAKAHCLRTLQARDAMPYYPFSVIQRRVVLRSVLAIVLLLPFAWRRRRTRLLPLTVVIVPTLVANAFVTAVFSVVDARYQARVIWLVPLLAALMALDLFTRSAELDSPTKKIDAPKGAPVSTHNSRTTHNCPTNSPTSLTGG